MYSFFAHLFENLLFARCRAGSEDRVTQHIFCPSGAQTASNNENEGEPLQACSGEDTLQLLAEISDLVGFRPWRTSIGLE